MTPPIPTRAEFIALLSSPPTWLRESLAGLSDAELDARPFAGKMSYREHLHHIVDADLGWTDNLYRCVLPHRPRYGTFDPAWKDGFAARARRSLADAITVQEESHAQVAAYVARLTDEDFVQPFPGVPWMVEAGVPLVVADHGRWGLYLHPYYHLAYMQRHRVALGRPLAAMEVYLTSCAGFDPQGAWPPWVGKE